MAKYLRTLRVHPPIRQVFLCLFRPRPLTAGAVSDAVAAAFRRAGLKVSRPGTHLLRHTLATHLVQQGASLKAIADVLGHRSINTTTVYAKVNRIMLAQIAHLKSRRQLGFALKSEHWALPSLAKYAQRIGHRGPLTCSLAVNWSAQSASRRDYAVLLLLARLGLRAGEVVHLTLENINWEAGEILIRGKSAREDRLPLPPDVGRALAAYLKRDRPACSCRRVFIRMKAPRRGFASSAAVCTLVRRALARADLHPSQKGVHWLRRSLVTKMLRRGVSLAQIGEVLRHQLAQTTEIYAKVDLVALRALAQPWPGGAQ
jgi:site-specific recombinase XerD